MATLRQTTGRQLHLCRSDGIATSLLPHVGPVGPGGQQAVDRLPDEETEEDAVEGGLLGEASQQLPLLRHRSLQCLVEQVWKRLIVL